MNPFIQTHTIMDQLNVSIDSCIQLNRKQNEMLILNHTELFIFDLSNDFKYKMNSPSPQNCYWDIYFIIDDISGDVICFNTIDPARKMIVKYTKESKYTQRSPNSIEVSKTKDSAMVMDDKQRLWVLNKGVLSIYDSNLVFVSKVDFSEAKPTEITSWTRITFDPFLRRIIILYTHFNEVIVISSDTDRYMFCFNMPESPKHDPCKPYVQNITTDSYSNIWFFDDSRKPILVFDHCGNFITEIPTPQQCIEINQILFDQDYTNLLVLYQTHELDIYNHIFKIPALPARIWTPNIHYQYPKQFCEVVYRLMLIHTHIKSICATNTTTNTDDIIGWMNLPREILWILFDFIYAITPQSKEAISR